jgi:hypothetical protein
MNCGMCGHSCLGGQCSGGACQPLLLGTVPVADFAEETFLSNGKVYVSGQVNTTGHISDLWQLDATTPGTPTEVTVPGTVSCILGQTLFWTTFDNPQQIFSCTLSNCPGTSTLVMTLAPGAAFGSLLRCDTSTGELVWTSSTDSANFAINRASSTGANSRVVTKLSFPNDGASWGLVNSGTQAGRIFYERSVTTVSPSGTTGSASLYYIATDVANAAGVLVSAVQNVTFGLVLASTNQVLVAASPFSNLSTTQELAIPLPNGLLSGAPPVFSNGYTGYGRLS